MFSGFSSWAYLKLYVPYSKTQKNCMRNILVLGKKEIDIDIVMVPNL